MARTRIRNFAKTVDIDRVNSRYLSVARNNIPEWDPAVTYLDGDQVISDDRIWEYNEDYHRLVWRTRIVPGTLGDEEVDPATVRDWIAISPRLDFEHAMGLLRQTPGEPLVWRNESGHDIPLHHTRWHHKVIPAGGEVFYCGADPRYYEHFTNKYGMNNGMIVNGWCIHDGRLPTPRWTPPFEFVYTVESSEYHATPANSQGQTILGGWDRHKQQLHLLPPEENYDFWVCIGEEDHNGRWTDHKQYTDGEVVHYKGHTYQALRETAGFLNWKSEWRNTAAHPPGNHPSTEAEVLNILNNRTTDGFNYQYTGTTDIQLPDDDIWHGYVLRPNYWFFHERDFPQSFHIPYGTIPGNPDIEIVNNWVFDSRSTDVVTHSDLTLLKRLMSEEILPEKGVPPTIDSLHWKKQANWVYFEGENWDIKPTDSNAANNNLQYFDIPLSTYNGFRAQWFGHQGPLTIHVIGATGGRIEGDKQGLNAGYVDLAIGHGSPVSGNPIVSWANYGTNAPYITSVTVEMNRCDDGVWVGQLHGIFGATIVTCGIWFTEDAQYGAPRFCFYRENGSGAQGRARLNVDLRKI